jgi:hypothetical protein
MFAKTLAIVVGLGLIAGAVLVNRQQRIDVAVEVARTGARLRAQEVALGAMQARIATEVRPDRVAARLDGLAAAASIEGWKAVPQRFDLDPPPKRSATPWERLAGATP